MRTISAACLCLLFSAVVLAQNGPTIDLDQVECLPIGDNNIAWATVDNNVADTTVRLNFRRLHDHVEDIYWVAMKPAGNGRYWGLFPKAEDRVVDRHELSEERARRSSTGSEGDENYGWAEWWREKQISDHRDPNDDLDDELIRERASVGKKEPREWMDELNNEQFEEWLEQLENEPSEYFATVNDFQGRRLARSHTKVVEVKEECRTDLTPQERGEAENLTVGETAYWQRGEEVFHWLCDGIVSRVDPNNVKRPDEYCRACIIAWWKRPTLMAPLAATGIVGIITSAPPPPASPSTP